MIKLQMLAGNPKTTDANVETKTPIEEARTEQHEDMKRQPPEAEAQAVGLTKDIDHIKDELTSDKYKVNLNNRTGYLPSVKEENLIQTSEFVQEKAQKKVGYIRKHWRGELNLDVSFWINVFLVNLVLKLGEPLSVEFIHNPVTTARVTIIYSVFVITILYPWQIIGLWRSCNSHIEIYGKRFWARTAQVLVVFGVIATLGNLTSSSPMYRELIQLGFGEDKYGNYSLKLEKNNTLLHLQGGLGFGISKKVRQFLIKYPGVKGIILDSYGGRIYEGRELSKLISAYDLDTYSLEGCYSAATIAFISGRKRFLGVGANLAFHQYSMDYDSFDTLVDVEEEQAKDLLLFQKQGIKSEFLDRIFDTDSDDLWYPAVDEMLDAGVIHGIVNPSDLVPMEYGSISKELNEIDEAIFKMPVYRTIKKYKPDIYRQIKAELEERIKKGATLIEIQNALSETIMPLGMSLMSQTSDEALIQFANTFIVVLKKLKEIDPIICLKALYPEQYGSIYFPKYISNDEGMHMLDALNRIIIDACEKENPVVDIDAAESQLGHLVIELGEDAKYLELGSLQNKNDYARHCNAVVKFYEMIVAKDKDEASNLLRYLMSIGIGTEEEESLNRPAKADDNHSLPDIDDFTTYAEKWLKIEENSNNSQKN